MVMETKTELTNSNSELSELTNSDSQKAWHIVAILLSLRRPARPIQLAIKCTLFNATPEFIEFLCFIPNSPIYLNSSYFVTFSSSGYLAIAQFVANSNVTLDFLPRFRLGLELGFTVDQVKEYRVGEGMVKTYSRKRKRMELADEGLGVAKRRGISDHFDAGKDNGLVLALPCATQNASAKAYFPEGNISGDITVQSCESPVVTFDVCRLEKAVLMTSSFISSNDGLSKIGIGDAGYGNEKDTPFFISRNAVNHASTTGSQFDSLDCHRYRNSASSMSEHKITRTIPCGEINHLSTLQNPAVSMKAEMNEESLDRKISFTGTFNLELDQRMEHLQKHVETVVHPCETTVQDLKIMESNQEEPYRGYFGNLLIDMTKTDILQKDKQLENVVEGCDQMIPLKEKEKGKTPLKSPATLTANALSLGRNQLGRTSPKSKTDQKQALSQRLHSTDMILENANTACSPLRQLQTRKDKNAVPSKLHLKYNCDRNMNAKEKLGTIDKNGESSFISSHDQPKQRVLPEFEPFIVEEEEGSGGYGTVYRARRKSDGVTFAIKCPHANANRNHVHNELKMLERFGGKNFVIRYEGSFKSGNSDCIVLEHVEHDRPEVLKRGIDVCELQWYGYCMFRALAGLHKQGIVHRDVKPGNFLFNRKACKGYLVDFNLAMDLNQKYSTIEKTKSGHDVSFNHVPLPRTKSLPPAKSRKFLTTKAMEIAHEEQGKVSRPLLLPKDMRKKIEKSNPCAEVGSRSIIKSQGADGSGITSAKDATSTKTPSAEKLREPLPCQGRKELINLVQEALQGANREAINFPMSKRKRVAAPPGKVDRKFVYLTPMPVHSAGGVVGGAGLLKNKGNGKNKREGPCVGTKGFRAPEVLFRSLHQGPKVDVWSAGVTLLYLLMGRTPFVGDPDQNVKEIVKLRGSEDLWEVAKLHSRESSFPADLFDIKSLPSMKLQDWCKHNTRRPDFIEVIPRSFFDLVDKCLTVNPRLRISAEEALRHEFFTPCHEALRKHRLLRQGVSLDSGTSVVINGQSQICEVS